MRSKNLLRARLWALVGHDKELVLILIATRSHESVLSYARAPNLCSKKITLGAM